MNYKKKTWINIPDPNNMPAIPQGQDELAIFDADNMNRIEEGILEAFDEIALSNIANDYKNFVIQTIGTSQTWVAPKAAGQLFKVICVGGGGGGGGGSFDPSSNGYSTIGGGGGGHITIKTLHIEEGTSIGIICGAGGAGGLCNKAGSATDGQAGGKTIFASVSANGGAGGFAGSWKYSNKIYSGIGGNGGVGSSGGGGGGARYNGDGSPQAGNGGDGYLCGGGGAGGTEKWNSVLPVLAKGGTRGVYGGEGGDSVERLRLPGVPEIKIVDILFQLDKLNKYITHMKTLSYHPTAIANGSGGLGGAGGHSGAETEAGGGGGGYCGDGGNGLFTGGGGGGGYCGDGGDGSNGGGGGGGFFCNGGDATTTNNETIVGGDGGDGGVIIMYVKEEE